MRASSGAILKLTYLSGLSLTSPHKNIHQNTLERRRLLNGLYKNRPKMIVLSYLWFFCTLPPAPLGHKTLTGALTAPCQSWSSFTLKNRGPELWLRFLHQGGPQQKVQSSQKRPLLRSLFCTYLSYCKTPLIYQKNRLFTSTN